MTTPTPTPRHPLTPLKNGVQSRDCHPVKHWIPTFVGMSGMLVVACSPQATEVVETTDAVNVVETPAPPTSPPSRTVDDIDFAAYSKSLAKFTGLKEGQSRWEAVDAVRLYFVPEEGTIIKTSQSSFDLPDGSVLLFSAAGLPDDSIKAEEIYLILSGPKEAQKLAAYGSRIKCHRGENTTEWQNTLCP